MFLPFGEVCAGGDGKERHGVSEPGEARLGVCAGQRVYRPGWRHDTGITIPLYIQVQGQNRHGVCGQDGQRAGTLPCRGGRVQDASMVLVDARWSCPVTCPLHRETDKQAERTWFFEDLIYGSFAGAQS